MLLGLDFGTDSVRALVTDASTGEEICTTVHYYKKWKKGKFCLPAENLFRQHPMDYLEAMERAVLEVLDKAPGGTRKKIKGIGVDTTGSTPVAVDRAGTPLALIPGFEENPNAMFILWKDHTAVQEASEINRLSHSWDGPDYTRYEGGIYSSEWFWAKILHVLREDSQIRENAFSWVEHCDWITAHLTGNTDPLTLKRSRCAAGHKAMWHESWGGLPSEEFLVALDPILDGIRDRMYTDTFTSDISAGYLSAEYCEKFGFGDDVAVAVGAFDAHMGAVGGQIREGDLVRIMGTSTCDIMITGEESLGKKVVPGICGQVNGSVIPGTIGLEAGQSAFGDVYAWFRDMLMWFPRAEGQLSEEELNRMAGDMIPMLGKVAAQIPITENDVVALDWLNGRRTPDANQNLKAAISGLSLGTSAPAIFKALVEATAFGSKRIVDRFIENGVDIRSVVALGGVAKKSDFVMQTLCDVLRMPIKVVRSEQTCALGAAMFAAVASGIYGKVEEARDSMGSGFEKEYQPDASKAEVYDKLYRKYLRLGEFVEEDLT